MRALSPRSLRHRGVRPSPACSGPSGVAFNDDEETEVHGRVQGAGGEGSLAGDRTVQQIAARHQLHPNQVSQWKRTASERLAELFERAAKPGQEEREAEFRKLHEKIGQLVVDFLKANWTVSALRITFSMLIALPACTAVNASPTASRQPAHDSRGSMNWLIHGVCFGRGAGALTPYPSPVSLAVPSPRLRGDEDTCGPTLRDYASWLRVRGLFFALGTAHAVPPLPESWP